MFFFKTRHACTDNKSWYIVKTSWYILETFFVKVGQVNKACQKNQLQFVAPFYLYNKPLVCKNDTKSMNLFILQTGSLFKLFKTKII